MTFDLRGALLRKQEVETARLLDFEFRLRARTLRSLAQALGKDEAELVRRIAWRGDDTIIASLAEEHGLALEDVRARWTECRDAARRGLIAEIGDPTPYRLA